MSSKRYLAIMNSEKKKISLKILIILIKGFVIVNYSLQKRIKYKMLYQEVYLQLCAKSNNFEKLEEYTSTKTLMKIFFITMLKDCI